MKITQSYYSIIKEAGLFSSVQIILLLISMVKGKFIAEYLGVEAIGILGILQTTIGFFIAFCSLGLPVLLARSYTLNTDEDSISKQIVIKRLLMVGAILGCISFYLFTPLFSSFFLNHKDYGWILKAIAIVIFFKQIAVINTSILQGKQQLGSLAKVNLISALVGLLFSIPLYYFFKIEGLIFAFIVSYFIEAVVSQSFLKNTINKQSISIAPKAYKSLLKEGFFVGYGNVFTLLAQFGVIYYVTSLGGNEQAGLYNAGFSIINNYVALLFIAMSTGYLPRLVKLLESPKNLQLEISKQLNFSIIVIGFLAFFCIIFADYIVKILFSNDFIEVVSFLRIAVFGMIFKAFSWSLGYLVIAKADTKILAFTGLFFNVLFGFLMILGYKYFGITGSAYAFVLYNFIHLLGIYLIIKFKYKLIISIESILLLVGMLLINGILLLL